MFLFFRQQPTYRFRGFDIPIDLMRLTGGGPETFDAISDAHLHLLQSSIGIRPTDCVLEIGCGIGRDAIPLTQVLTNGRYIGIDIVGRSISWCRTNIGRRFPNFSFHHFNVRDQLHNPRGWRTVQSVRFPAKDSSADIVLAQSVFTHMYADGIAHYLREIRRVLKPSGMTYITCYVFDDQILESARRTNLTPFDLRFEHAINDECRINDPVHPLGAIAYTLPALERMAAAAGLRLAKPIARGYWSGYFPKWLDGQDVLFLSHQL